MWPLFIVAGFLSLFSVLSGLNDSFTNKSAVTDRETAVMVAKYQSFAQSAAAYMAANPSANGAILWSTISASPVVPPAYKQASINSSWKIMADGAGNFVICAELPEIAIAGVASLMPETNKPVISSDGKVVFAASAVANTESAKCN